MTLKFYKQAIPSSKAQRGPDRNIFQFFTKKCKYKGQLTEISPQAWHAIIVKTIVISLLAIEEGEMENIFKVKHKQSPNEDNGFKKEKNITLL